MRSTRQLFSLFLLVCISLSVGSSTAFAQTKPKRADERVDVEKLKRQYWREEGEVDVVQNRIYQKSRRFELGVNGGVFINDPFLSNQSLGGTAGYHFNEYLSLHVLMSKIFSRNSDAVDYLEKSTGATANTNPPSWFFGGEAAWSFVYGKLSLVGNSILYFDMHLLGGAGRISTLSGDNFMVHTGLGQQIWLSNDVALRIDYRLMRYNETVTKNSRAQTDTGVGSRVNWTHNFVLGVSFFP